MTPRGNACWLAWTVLGFGLHPIALIDSVLGEQTAQACAKAWLRQLPQEKEQRAK